MSDNRTILYIGGFELPDRDAASQRAFANAKAFRDLGYTVYFIGIEKKCKLPVEKTNMIFEGFSTFRIKYPKTLLEWYDYLFNIDYVKELSFLRPSIIIAYNYPAFALNKLHKYSLRNQIHLIADCTEWFLPEGNILYRIIKKIDTKYRMEKIHPKLDGMIAISKYLFDYYTIRMNNVIQIPPLVDKRMDKWVNEGDNCNPNIVLTYAGSPGSGNKDKINLVLRVLKDIKEHTKLAFEMFVIGISESQYKESFKDYNHYNDFVCFKGRISHKEALTAIKQSDYMIFLRDNNLVTTAGFPTKFPEAIACGTPVLTNLSSDIGMYLKDGINGFLIDVTSYEKIYSSIYNALCQNKRTIKVMKYNCRNDATFDYHSYLFEFNKLLNNLEIK